MNALIILALLKAQHDAAERDRYRTALEQIMGLGRGLHVEIARDALTTGKDEE